MANNVLAGYFNENELQHQKRMLAKNFQSLLDNNWPEGGGFAAQLSSDVPFSVPMVRRQNNDNNLYGDVWGGWLNEFLVNNYNRKNTASLSDYGWGRDESSGFIMQWGRPGSSNVTYNFPREFPASCFVLFVTNTNQQGAQWITHSDIR